MRLRQRAEFVAVAKGRRVHLPALTLQAQRRGETMALETNMPPAYAGPRFGLTVTNKTGNSPERNRMRRRLREALRLGRLPAQDMYDYVIVARRTVLSLPFADLQAELERALRQIHAPRGAGKPSKQTRQADLP